MSHIADFALVTCIDFRFQNYIDTFLKTQMKGKNYDRISVAGSTKDRSYVLSQIEISQRLHRINEVVILHHENCGAYGSEDSQEKHREEMGMMENEIIQRYPGMKVRKYYLKLNGELVEEI